MTNKLRGVTLLEIMLVLSLGLSIVLFGLKQYQQYKLEQEVEQVKYNVALLFQGLSEYYFANCAGAVNGQPGVTGTLAPGHAPAPANPFVMTIASDLNGYINWPPANNPLLDATFGYVAQFNEFISSVGARTAMACWNYGALTCSSSSNASSQIILWQAQVVVKMSDSSKTLAYKGSVNADCAISSFSSPQVVNCGTDGVTTGSPSYLVWQRLPSFASPEMSSSLRGTIPSAKEFNMQYTNDAMGELYGVPSYTGTQNYLCGG